MKGGIYVALCAVTLVSFSAGGVSGGGTPVQSREAGNQGGRKSAGVGVYAYQDSNGNRYEGVYDIDPSQIGNFVYAPNFQEFIPDFSQDFLQKFPFSPYAFGNPLFNMDPEYYMNLGQQYAQAGMQFGQQFVPNFRRSGTNPGHGSAPQSGMPVGNSFVHTSSRFGGDQGSGGSNQGHAGASQEHASSNQRQGAHFGGSTGNFQNPARGNLAFAGAFIGPDGARQVASISPPNAKNPNIDVSSPSSGGHGRGGFYTVSSSSFASSSDVNGKKTENRHAKTVINDNGNIKEYEVKN